MHENALHDPQIRPDAKTQVSVTAPIALFVESVLGPAKHEKQCVDILWPDAP
jgi:hypothetical protein